MVRPCSAITSPATRSVSARRKSISSPMATRGCMISGHGAGAPAPCPEIMHPLVAMGEEMDFLRALTDRVAGEVMAEQGRTIDYSVGVMVELPRAALRAGDLARSAQFFSF